jgi:hypothetical protein
MCPEIGHVKLICAMVALALSGGIAGAQTVPLPRPRPAPTSSAVAPALASLPPKPVTIAEPSACRLRLTSALAVAPSLPPITGPGECGAPDVVRLEAVVLADHSRVPLNPPATLRCTMAEAVAHWVREEAVPRALDLGSPLLAIQNFDSFDCRGRNRIAGAIISEHGKGNALDIKGLKLADGRLIHLTDPKISHGYRDGMRTSVCGRFTTVLGPGSDGYHEDHIHVDLAVRRNGFRLCHWEVRDPKSAPAVASEVITTGAVAAAGTTAAAVPLPPPRPKIERVTAKRKPDEAKSRLLRPAVN